MKDPVAPLSTKAWVQNSAPVSVVFSSMLRSRELARLEGELAMTKLLGRRRCSQDFWRGRGVTGAIDKATDGAFFRVAAGATSGRDASSAIGNSEHCALGLPGVRCATGGTSGAVGSSELHAGSTRGGQVEVGMASIDRAGTYLSLSSTAKIEYRL